MARLVVVIGVIAGCSSPRPPAPAVHVPAVVGASPADALVPQPPPAQIAAGGSHTCLVDRGVLWCWGNSDHGQVGDGTRAEALVPTRIADVANPIAIALGHAHSCALDQAGVVWCWGQIERDQWDQPVDVLAPKRIALAERAVDISAGHAHTCARLATNQVACWGSDREKQLGGAGADRIVPGLRDVTAIRLGGSTSCALHAGRVVCWGGHWLDGFLGAGNQQFAGGPTDVPDLAGAAAIAVGGSHVCGIRAGKVTCHGSNLHQQLGDPKAPCCAPTTAVVPDLDDVVAISAGLTRTCALRATGKVTCWGDSHIAHGAQTFALDAVQLAVGEFHACALTARHEAWCWGNSDRGQLGDGVSARVPTPTKVLGIDDAVELAPGYIHNCVRRNTGAIACWGPGADQALAADVTAFGIADHATSGTYESCAVRGSQIKCMQRHRDYAPGPVTVPGGVVSVIHGDAICAVTKDRKVACVDEVPDAHTIPGDLPPRTATVIAAFTGVDRAWFAQQLCATTKTQLLCTYSTQPSTKPKVIAGIAGRDVVDVADLCAVLRDGHVACWGGGDTAEVMPTISDAIAITGGAYHTCVLRKAGDVWCWGSDDVGQLGDGDRDFTRRPDPAPVGGLTGVLELAAGGEQTCARTADGVYCWGSNESGRLGIGHGSIAPDPVRVLGLPSPTVP